MISSRGNRSKNLKSMIYSVSASSFLEGFHRLLARLDILEALVLSRHQAGKIELIDDKRQTVGADCPEPDCFRNLSYTQEHFKNLTTQSSRIPPMFQFLLPRLLNFIRSHVILQARTPPPPPPPLLQHPPLTYLLRVQSPLCRVVAIFQSNAEC